MANNLAKEEDEMSMEDDIARTLAEINAREDDETNDEVESNVEDDIELDSEVEPLEEGEQEAEIEQVDEVVKDDKSIIEQSEIKRPPSSWSAKGKSEFATLPPHIQDEVLKRENDFHNGIAQYKEKADFGDKIYQTIAPYEAIIRSKNSTPEQAISNLLNTSYILETASPQQKTQLIMQIAKEYGADMSSFGNIQQDETPDYIRQLQQQVVQLQQNAQSQQSYAQQQTETQATGSIDKFRNEVDASGNLAHLYFDDVRNTMADMIEAADRQGRQLDLKSAYDAAVWADPNIRDTLLATQQQQESEKRKQEKAQKAQQARKRDAVNIIPKGSHANSTTKQVGSVDDTIRETLNKINARDD